MSALAMEKNPRAHIRPCRIVGCDGFAWDGDLCNKCSEEIAALKRWAADSVTRHKAARRLKVSTVAYACAVLAAEWYLLWQFRGWFVELFQLWFR